MKKTLAIIASTTLLLSLTTWAQAAEQSGKVRLYGNEKCPATGNPVYANTFTEIKLPGGNTYGRVYLCCAGCASKVKADPAKYYKQLFLTGPDGQVKPIRELHNAQDPVSGEVSDPSLTIVYNGLRLGFAKKENIPAFLKNPNTYLAKLLPDEGWYTPAPGMKPDAHQDHH